MLLSEAMEPRKADRLLSRHSVSPGTPTIDPSSVLVAKSTQVTSPHFYHSTSSEQFDHPNPEKKGIKQLKLGKPPQSYVMPNTPSIIQQRESQKKKKEQRKNDPHSGTHTASSPFANQTALPRFHFDHPAPEVLIVLLQHLRIPQASEARIVTKKKTNGDFLINEMKKDKKERRNFRQVDVGET